MSAIEVVEAVHVSLEPISRAERLLAEASTVVELVDVIDMGEAARILALKAKLGLAAQNHAGLEEWYCEVPPKNASYRVLDEWSDDFVVRRIYRIEDAS